MIQVGIFTGYFPYTLEETAKKIRALGFNTVQLDLGFTDMDLSYEGLTPDKCKQIRDTFRKHDLPICCISGYTNFIHPDPGQQKANMAMLKKTIECAKYLGTPYVISETGTLNPENEWMPHPDNKTEEGYAKCRDAIAEIVQCAGDNGATFLLETYVNNVIGSIEETERLFADINHPALELLMDPTNYFETHNIGNMDGELNRIFDSLSHHVKIGHAKDVKMIAEDKGVQISDDAGTEERHALKGVGQIELPPPGLGELNYDLYIQRLGADHPNIPLIIEHLPEDDVPRAKKFIDEKLTANGF
jgi:sugar phosphate isomerase/epimerase